MWLRTSALVVALIYVMHVGGLQYVDNPCVAQTCEHSHYNLCNQCFIWGGGALGL